MQSSSRIPTFHQESCSTSRKRKNLDGTHVPSLKTKIIPSQSEDPGRSVVSKKRRGQPKQDSSHIARSNFSTNSLHKASSSRKSKQLCSVSGKFDSKKENSLKTQSQISKLTEDVVELKKQIVLLKAENTKLDSDLSKVEMDKNELLTTVDRLKNEVTQLNLSLDAVKQQNTCLMEDLRQSRNRGRDYEKTLRRMNNTIIDLKGNIRVCLRVRPFLSSESKSMEHISFPNEQSILLKDGRTSVQHEFQRVWSPLSSQHIVFEDISELIENALYGYNVAIVAYGQTGSGKTYTMQGGEGCSSGIIPRAVEYLFEKKRQLNDIDWTYNFAASCMEVYNEDVYDLLSSNGRRKLEVRFDGVKVLVPGLSTPQVNSTHEMVELMKCGNGNRSIGATKCNSRSSRGHTIFQIRINSQNTVNEDKCQSVLSLVDLAGSERVDESGSQGQSFIEMTHINQALSNLRNVLRSLLKRAPHIPYRNNKLTTLLAETLGAGNSKTLMIVNLSPSLSSYTESKRSIEFAVQTCSTKIGAAKKQMPA